jgi:Carbohydrate family 9 binding domain-like
MKKVFGCIVLIFGMLSCPLIADEGDYVCDGKNLMQFIDGALEKAGKEIIAADFSKKDTARWNYKKVNHCWEVKDKTIATTTYGGHLPLKANIKGGFVVKVKVKPIAYDPKRKGGFAGLSVQGVLFVLTDVHYKAIYKRPGEKRSTGKCKQEKIPFKRWYDFKIVVRPGGVYEWFVDGRRIADFVEPELKGGIGLQSWRVKVAYKDFKVFKIEQSAGKNASTGINRVRNSSFEIFNDNLPPYWRPQGFRDIPFTHGTNEKFYKEWKLDSAEKFDGKYSLRMKNCKSSGVRSYFCSIPKGDCVLSFYMKSNVEAMPVKTFLAGVPGRKTFTVGKEWKRYSMTFNNKSKSRCRFYVLPGSTDTLWLDAIQLENGKVATAYKPNPLDNIKSTSVKKKKPPVSRIARVKQAPVIDGKLNDAAWKNAAKAPKFRIPENIPGKYKIPKEKTEAYLCYDDKALYIGIKCYDSNIDKLKAIIKENRVAVAGDECIELFLDTNNDKKTFYRFVVNSLGYKAESKGSNDFGWSRDWEVKTSKKKKFWAVEIAIPLASLDLDSLISDVWAMNICRSNNKAVEYSCTSPVPKKGMYFHNVANYSTFKWDDAKAFKQYRWTIKDLSLAAGKKGKLDLTGEVVNQSSEDMRLAAVAEIAGEKKQSKVFEVKHGSKCRFLISGFKNAKSKDVVTQIRLVAVNNKQTVAQATARVSRSELMNAVADYSYYTTEDKALVTVSLAKLADGASLHCELRNKAGKTVFSSKHKANKTIEVLSLPLKKLPCGDYDARIKLLVGKKLLTSTTESIRKLPPKKGEVKVERIKRYITVDGKPFFPFAPLQVFHVASHQPYRNYDEKIDILIKYWADLGFKTLMAGANIDKVKGKWGVRIWNQIFKSARKHNMKIIAFWTGPSYKMFPDKELLKAHIERWKDEPALLAWMPEDEPEIKHVKPIEISNAVKFIQKLDPYHLTYVNYTQMGPTSRYAGLPGDVMSLDFYLTSAQGRTVEDTLKYADIMREVSEPMHVPVWNFIAGSNLDNHTREPSAGEQVAQTYGNIIKGVTGLTYFFGQLAGREHWKKFMELNREIKQLTPVILTGTEMQIKSSNPSVLSVIKKYKNSIYLICVNIEDSKKDVKFDLSTIDGVSNQAAVIFENRNIVLKGGLLNTKFNAYERHVYRIKIK